MLREFAPDLYTADGPEVPFYGFPYPTRMAVARQKDGGLWVWSPIALDEELAVAVDALGPVRFIVSPNKIHHLFMPEWAERWPGARLYAPPGLADRKPEVRFHAELGDQSDDGWSAEIDQLIFKGSFAMHEVVFFHRASRTAIIGDLIQRHHEADMHGWKGLLMRLDGLVGEHGSTPREWRLSFVRRRQARAARDQLLSWHPQRLIIAHGECVPSNAEGVIADALSWI